MSESNTVLSPMQTVCEESKLHRRICGTMIFCHAAMKSTPKMELSPYLFTQSRKIGFIFVGAATNQSPPCTRQINHKSYSCILLEISDNHGGSTADNFRSYCARLPTRGGRERGIYGKQLHMMLPDMSYLFTVNLDCLSYACSLTQIIGSDHKSILLHCYPLSGEEIKLKKSQ